MKNHGKTFFWATAFLEKKTANNLYSVYAFCRRIDDLIDKNPNHDTSYKVFFTAKNAWDKNKYIGIPEDRKAFFRDGIIFNIGFVAGGMLNVFFVRRYFVLNLNI